ncbi:MAG: hypothetical protein RL258_988, partial [Pseudomonadota bacterium]
HGGALTGATTSPVTTTPRRTGPASASAPTLSTKEAAESAIEVTPDFVEIRRTIGGAWPAATASVATGALLSIGPRTIVLVCATMAIGIAWAIGLSALIV